MKKITVPILEDNVAIFAGAGLSMASEFVSWKGMLRGMASELGLDIDKEHDLIGIAQYYVNNNRSRGELNQRIIEEFTKDVQKSDVHTI